MDEQSSTGSTPAAASGASSKAAIARYSARIRPRRIAYGAAVIVAAAVLMVVVVIVYARGEISHASLHTVTSAPPSVALAPPTATLTRSWSSSDVTAIGTPYWNGTIVTHDEHSVRGRDGRTGEQTWVYTRTDRTVCTAMQDGGLTLAVYRQKGRCDEITALDSDTGARSWTRTLFEDGASVDGPPSYGVQPGNFFFVSRAAIYSISANGVDWWTFHHTGCTINSAILGSAGALISQSCHGEQCGDARFCGDGSQLLLRQAETGVDNTSTTNHKNPDQIVWNHIGGSLSTLVPTSAGATVTARAPSGDRLSVLDSVSGARTATLTLAPSTGTSATVHSTNNTDLLWIAGRSYALSTGSATFEWTLATLGPAIAEPADAGDLTDAEVSVATDRGVALLAPDTGRAQRGFTVPPPAAGSPVYRFGAGFLVGGSSTTVYR